MIRKYHNHKPQTTPWHREEEPLHHHETPGRQIKQSNQLSLPHQDDCNTILNHTSNAKSNKTFNITYIFSSIVKLKHLFMQMKEELHRPIIPF